MATNPKRSSSKSVGNPCVSSFQFRGRTMTVEMVDPVIELNANGGLKIPYLDGGRYSGGRKVVTDTHIKMVDVNYAPPTWGTFYDTPDAKHKDKVLNGFYCPATFRVTGFHYDLTVTTGVKRLREGSTAKKIAIVSLTVGAKIINDDNMINRATIAKIPVAMILEHAIRASQFTARYTAQFSPLPNLKIVKLGNTLTNNEVDNLAGRKRRGKPKRDDVALSDKSVKEYARHWHACPANYPGGKDAYIANQMVMSDGSPLYGSATRNRQLRRARDIKRIPAVPRKYNYKRTTKKRVKK